MKNYELELYVCDQTVYHLFGVNVKQSSVNIWEPDKFPIFPLKGNLTEDSVRQWHIQGSEIIKDMKITRFSSHLRCEHFSSYEVSSIKFSRAG